MNLETLGEKKNNGMEFIARRAILDSQQEHTFQSKNQLMRGIKGA